MMHNYIIILDVGILYSCCVMVSNIIAKITLISIIDSGIIDSGKSRHTVVCRAAQESGVPPVSILTSRHTVVCRVAQEAGVPPVSILTGRKKTQFSHLCSSVIPYPIGTKFAREVPASKGSLHTKLEENRSSHFRDTSEQNFVLISSFFSSTSSFRTFAKSAIKHECVLGSG